MQNVMDKPDTKESSKTLVVPILPVKGSAVFPHMVVPLLANEQKQARLIDEALMHGNMVGIFQQIDQNKEDPGQEDHAADSQGDKTQPLAQTRELPLQRRLLRPDGLDHVGDPADLGVHSRGADQRLSTAPGHDGA